MSGSFSRIRIECLDGLRGLAALWVLVGHANILTGFRIPLLGDPDLGVDLFILLSGFLMVFQYHLRKTGEPWENPTTWRSFWIRRFFRIAPLYYLILAIAIPLGPTIYNARMKIDAFNGVLPQPPERYLDQGFLNWLTHLSFTFGAIPSYSYKTALPDWSIGLEMQFYLAFPFLMLIIKKIGIFSGLACIVSAGVAVATVAHLLGYDFPMPAFLPLKMHIFAAGMLMASVIGDSPRRAMIAAIAGICLMIIPFGGSASHLHMMVRICVFLGFFILVHHDKVPVFSVFLSKSASVLGNRFFHQLGELSFGAYLIHLLVMQPVVATLVEGWPMSNAVRWVATLGITIPIVYLIAAATYRLVEIPGQRLGRIAIRYLPTPADGFSNSLSEPVKAALSHDAPRRD